MALLQVVSEGLYCPAGDFYIDPWKPVARAVVTHAHSDHARWGSEKYLAAASGHAILRMRLGPDANIRFVPYGEVTSVNGVEVSLHPAGHITGSAQVRVAHRGEVWVVTGDYKLQPDSTCVPFEPIRCHTFITESTFGLPIYRWQPPQEVYAEVNSWWRENQRQGRASLIYGYSVGKAQRILSGIDATIGPVFGHGAILNACHAYTECGVKLPEVRNVASVEKRYDWSTALIVAPPSAHGSTWAKRFGNVSTAMASGWMRVRGIRRRRAVDRGFVLSDHVDWPSLLTAIGHSEAKSIGVTHGYTEPVVKYLREHGFQAWSLATQYGGEVEDAEGEA